MASIRIVIAVAIVAAVVAPTFATDVVVGDDKVFKYPQGFHNVFRVNGTAFQQCAPQAASEPLTTCNDVITLATPGKKWYICGVGSHCESGDQKLAITVLAQVGSPASAPSPIPPHSAANGLVPSKFFATAFGVLMMMMMIMV